MFFTVNGRRIPSGALFVSMADKRHQKAIAKGIVCQVAYNHQNDYRRAQKLVPAKDLAKEMPEKLHELQRQFIIEGTRYQVLPLDDRVTDLETP